MPPGIRTNKFEGTRGEIKIPSLGILVSRLDKPVLLRRREAATPELGSFDLYAAVSYFNEHLWSDDDYPKEIVFYLGRVPLKVHFLTQSTLVKETGRLRIEGVEPEWHEA